MSYQQVTHGCAAAFAGSFAGSDLARRSVLP